MTLPSRRVLLAAAGAILLIALLLGIPWLSPARGVERSWKNLVEALQNNDQAELATYLGNDYKDGFGLDREGALKLAANLRGQFIVCAVRRENRIVQINTAHGRAAVTGAIIRIDGQGTPLATAVIQASQASQSPTEFHWRRNSWKPWDWRLIAVYNADAARGIARFQREAASFGLTP